MIVIRMAYFIINKFVCVSVEVSLVFPICYEYLCVCVSEGTTLIVFPIYTKNPLVVCAFIVSNSYLKWGLVCACVHAHKVISISTFLLWILVSFCTAVFSVSYLTMSTFMCMYTTVISISYFLWIPFVVCKNWHYISTYFVMRILCVFVCKMVIVFPIFVINVCVWTTVISIVL